MAAEVLSPRPSGTGRSSSSVDREKKSESKRLKLYLLTWNVGGSVPPSDLSGALSLTQNPLPDVYGIGLQEVNDGFNLEWLEAFTLALSKHNFVRIKYRRLQGLLTVIFVKRSHLDHCTSFESEATRTGFGGWWGNKGGVSVRMDILGVNFIVVNCHLAAHQDSVQERIMDYNSIIDSQKFKDRDVGNILDHDYVFWMGDLNFRLDQTTRRNVEEAVKKNDYTLLLPFDQLNVCRENGLIFVDFKEGTITFPPTYKFDPLTNVYDTSSKQRVPAWCDRILWYQNEAVYSQNFSLQVQQLEYTSHSAYCCSDHKPVTATFLFTVYPKPPMNPVHFEQIETWHRGQSHTVRYYIKCAFLNIKTVDTDWIGLYAASFEHFEKYVTYVNATEGAENNAEGIVVTFSARSLDVPPGQYCLCYLTKKYSLLGISHVFSIVA